MKRMMLIIILILVANFIFALKQVTSIGNFHAGMSAKAAFVLVGDRVLKEKHISTDYTLYNYGDIILYVAEGKLTGVKLWKIKGQNVLGYEIGDEMYEQQLQNDGWPVNDFGGEFYITGTGVTFFVGNRIYSCDMPENIIYAIQVDF